MDFKVENHIILEQQTDCLMLTIRQGDTQSELVKQCDDVCNGMLMSLIKSGDFIGKKGESVVLYNVPNMKAKKILLVGIGNNNDDFTQYLPQITKSIARQLVSLNSSDLLIPVECSDNIYLFIRQFVEMINFHHYQFTEYQTEKTDQTKMRNITFSVSDASLIEDAEKGLKHGIAIADGVTAARTVANQPPNICNPQFLADKAKLLTKQFKALKTTYYNEKSLAKLGMNTYLAVGQGSSNESIMTVMEYQGSKDESQSPIVLVGKGLTFDSGGISIKPSAGMDEMKYDMCGAATVYGVMQAVAELNLPIHVIGVMAGCENMPGTGAYRPGDILTTLSGQTVEVINTDAEGRLVLCDVLTFIERFKPKAVIDIATLTGACVIALGHHYTGVMGNNDQLIDELIDASKTANDKAWPLPLDERFQAQIKSSCADIMNAAGRDGGTITAGCFLSRFAKNYHWAHLDIAGTAWVSGNNKGATGRPVSMLIQYLLNSASE